ncbi:MAG: peptidylprolyl isomerase [Gammaproteobacteria bacterium]|nr:peptidylprolyl isomerase [Gammaproteobacteria bacterium]MDH4256251.1 peptidylprolyl isomerase [Gammaproteobacteria bacterium]MDH5271950.1 peptidylprolyl isomerase [Gammaproteobacteria bacterium]
MTRSVLLRIVREPLFAFVVIGGVLYLAYAGTRSRESEPVILRGPARAELIAGFETLRGRKATADDIARIERDYVTDELLFRAALENGLHLSNPSVRSKLVEEMRFRITGPLPDPTDEQLVNYYSDNLDRYRSEPAVTFRQIYFAQRPADPSAILAQLRLGQPVNGEPFRHGSEFPRYGHSMIRGMFGQPIVAALSVAPLGQWIGPLESPYGWHYLQATERLPATLLPFHTVRQQVENDFLVTLIDAAVDRHVDELRQRHAVRIER